MARAKKNEVTLNDRVELLSIFIDAVVLESKATIAASPTMRATWHELKDQHPDTMRCYAERYGIDPKHIVFSPYDGNRLQMQCTNLPSSCTVFVYSTPGYKP